MISLKEFNQLFNQYYQPFLRFAISYVRDSHIGEEITAESFSIFWEKRNEISVEVNRPAYLLTIIKNLSLNYLKRDSLSKSIVANLKQDLEWDLSTRINHLQACDPEHLFSKEIETILNNAIEKLPKRTREVFVLSRLEHLSHKEIAEKLNISTKGVEYHMSQSLRLLRSMLKDYLPLGVFILIKSLFLY